jgi:hypothetical protein
MRAYFSTSELKKTYSEFKGLRPNPTRAEFKVSYFALSHRPDAEINLYSLDGKHVHQVVVQDSEGVNTHTINVEHLPTGMYIARIENSACDNLIKVIKVR